MRDVMVIGGGVAGLTAARELRHDGVDVLVLEARERLGGRAWTIQAADHNLELGAAYVTWHQPHVWAELTRYGLGVTPSRTPKRAAWVVEGDSGGLIRPVRRAPGHGRRRDVRRHPNVVPDAARHFRG